MYSKNSMPTQTITHNILNALDHTWGAPTQAVHKAIPNSFQCVPVGFVCSPQRSPSSANGKGQHSSWLIITPVLRGSEPRFRNVIVLLASSSCSAYFLLPIRMFRHTATYRSIWSRFCRHGQEVTPKQPTYYNIRIVYSTLSFVLFFARPAIRFSRLKMESKVFLLCSSIPSIVLRITSCRLSNSWIRLRAMSWDFAIFCCLVYISQLISAPLTRD